MSLEWNQVHIVPFETLLVMLESGWQPQFAVFLDFAKDDREPTVPISQHEAEKKLQVMS